MRQLSTAKRVLILTLLVEGNSMRSIARSLGVSFNTVNKLLQDAGIVCLKYHDKKVRGVKCKRIQCDEIWTYCYAKDKNLAEAISAPPYAGSIWTWIALDEGSRLIVTFEVGDRSAETALEFMTDLESRIEGRVQITTDGHKPYIEAVREAFADRPIDYAQLVKMFDGKPKFKHYPDGSMKPIKGSVVGQKTKVILGKPKKKKAGTSYVERHNLTIRTNMRRFTRKTNAFSRTLKNHIYEQCLYVTHYNFIRIHESLGMTPAMAAGITSKPRDLEWLVRKIDKAAPKPNRPRRYKKRQNEVVNRE